MPDTVDTMLRAHYDGSKYHSKHVEHLTGVNKLYTVSSCWIIIAIYYTMHGPLNIKFTVLSDTAPCSLVGVYRWFGGMCCLLRQGIIPNCIASYSRALYSSVNSNIAVHRTTCYQAVRLLTDDIDMPRSCMYPVNVSFCLSRDSAPVTDCNVIWRAVCLLNDLFQFRYSCLTASSSSTHCWKCAKGSVSETFSFEITHL